MREKLCQKKTQKKEAETDKIIELRATLEKEPTALLAHPLVPNDFKKVFGEKQ